MAKWVSFPTFRPINKIFLNNYIQANRALWQKIKNQST